MDIITREAAKSLAKRIDSLWLACDWVHEPVFPAGRKDVCAITKTTENGTDYGYDTVYVLWLQNGELKNTKIERSREYRYVVGVSITTDNMLVVEMTGNMIARIKLTTLGLS